MNTIFSKGSSEILKQEFSEVTLGHLKEKVLKGVMNSFVLCFKQSEQFYLGTPWCPVENEDQE